MAFSFSLGSNKTSARQDRYRGRSARSQRRNAKNTTSSIAIIATICTGLALASGTLGYFVWQDMNTPKADEYACYPQTDQAQTVIFVDSSNPRADAAQGRDISAYVSDHYFRRAAANERIRVYNTEVDQIGSIPDPVVETCVLASNNTELEALGAPSANPAYLTTQKQRIFDDKIAPVLTSMTDQSPVNPQRFESPILEQIQGLSRLPEFQNANADNSLVIVSDMIQATQEIRACYEAGHLPRFENFKNGENWPRVKPASLEGVDVTVLMLIRHNYGTHCSGADELIRWWDAYFKEAGAKSISFTRLRFDASGGQ